MKFVDHVTISVTAGKGGPGSASFRREKYIPKGGPDGGNGGEGGDIILEASTALQTLMDLKIKRHYKAQSGEPGRGRLQFGRRGEDCVIKVPVGTMIFDQNNTLLFDLSEEGQVIVAKGGKGGKGNKEFATSINRAPRYAQSGLPGQSATLQLELKMLAEVGLVGLPNAGKSTLLKALTKANPKIADYPFTTLFPNLGVLKTMDREIVIADIPGLVEGASEGIGLGKDFLRHVHRNKILCHLVSMESGDGQTCLENFNTIQKEMRKSIPGFDEKKMFIVLSKADTVPQDIQEDILLNFKKIGIPYIVISAISGQNLTDLTHLLLENLNEET